MENLIILTVKSTHFYLIDGPRGRLLVDTGWAGSLPAFKSELKRWKTDLSEIRYVMITHHHPDHAGLTQEIKNAAGARLVIHTAQIPHIKELLAFHQKKGDASYLPIQVTSKDIVLPSDNRDVLRALGFAGVVIETPGHSDDSVSLLLDSGLAFTGDLTLPQLAGPENETALRESWQRLIQGGAKTVYPAHANPFPIDFAAMSL